MYFYSHYLNDQLERIDVYNQFTLNNKVQKKHT